MNLFNVNVSEWTSMETPGDFSVGADFVVDSGLGEGQIANTSILTITPDNSPSNISGLGDGQEYVVSAAAFSVPTNSVAGGELIIDGVDDGVNTADETWSDPLYNDDNEVIGSITMYNFVPNYLNGIDQGQIGLVRIYDTGVAGTPGNTVEVQVILSAYWQMPNEDYTIHLDLDGAATVYQNSSNIPPLESEQVWSFILTNAIWPGQRPLASMNAIQPTLLSNDTLRAWGSDSSIKNITNGSVAMFQAEYTLDTYEKYLQYEAQGKQDPTAIENCTITAMTPSGFEVIDGTWSMVADGEDNPFPRADLYSIKWKITPDQGFTVDASDFQIMSSDHVYAPIGASSGTSTLHMMFSQYETIDGQPGYHWLNHNNSAFGGYYGGYQTGFFNTSAEYYNDTNEWQTSTATWEAWNGYDLDLTGPYGLGGRVGRQLPIRAYGFFYFTDGEDNQGTHVDNSGNYSWNFEADYQDMFFYLNGSQMTTRGWDNSTYPLLDHYITNNAYGSRCEDLGYTGDCRTFDISPTYPTGILEPNSPDWGITQNDPSLSGTGPSLVYSYTNCNCLFEETWPSQYIGKIPWQEQYYYTASELEDDIFPDILWASELDSNYSYPPQQVTQVDGNTTYGPEYYYEEISGYEFGAYVWHNPSTFAFLGDGDGWKNWIDGGLYINHAGGPNTGTYPGHSTSPVKPLYANLKVYHSYNNSNARVPYQSNVNPYQQHYDLQHCGNVSTLPGTTSLQMGVFKKVLLSNTNPGDDYNEVIVEAFIDKDAVRLFNGDSAGGYYNSPNYINTDTDPNNLNAGSVNVANADWYNSNAWIALQINGSAQPLASQMPPPQGMPVVSNFNIQIVDNLIDSNSGSITITPRREVGLRSSIEKEGFDDQKNIYSLFGNIRYNDNRPIATITFDASKDADGKYTHYFPSKPKIYQDNTASRLGFDFIENVRLVFKEKDKNNKLVYNMFLNIKDKKADLQDMVVNVNYKQKQIRLKGKAITRVDIGRKEISSIGENKIIKVYGVPGSKFMLEINAIIKQFDDGAQSWNVDGKPEETSRSKRSVLVKSTGNYSKVEDGGQSGKVIKCQIDKNGKFKTSFKIPPSSTEQSYEIEIVGDTNKDGSLTIINSNVADIYTITQYPTPNLVLTASTAGNAFTITDHKGTTGAAGANSVITYKGALNKTRKQLENSRNTKTLINFSYLLDLTDNTKVFQTAIAPDLSHFKNSYKLDNGGTVFQVSKVKWTDVDANTITLTGDLRIIKWGNKTVNLTLDLDQLITHNQ